MNQGFLTTYQDLGRPDMLKFALPPSGAMDETSLRFANLLVKNPESAATLETTAMGLALKALDHALIAVTGADLGMVVNGKAAPMWTVLNLEKGDVLRFTNKRKGLRAYLAIAGGFDAPFILGSRSVYLRGGIGMVLKKGDLIRSLPFEHQTPHVGRSLADKFQPALDLSEPIRVLPGPQFDYFTPKGQETFTESVYSISPISDRQGCRTEGPSIERDRGPDIITDPIPLGSIQVPGNGLPIILLKDAQVTGGYAKIGIVARVDVDRVGQLSPGDHIRFNLIGREEALDLLKRQLQLLDNARQILGDASEEGIRNGL
jgi:biotin-dependent carboxylase-like uncharacterized protein